MVEYMPAQASLGHTLAAGCSCLLPVGAQNLGLRHLNQVARLAGDVALDDNRLPLQVHLEDLRGTRYVCGGGGIDQHLGLVNIFITGIYTDNLYTHLTTD